MAYVARIADTWRSTWSHGVGGRGVNPPPMRGNLFEGSHILVLLFSKSLKVSLTPIYESIWNTTQDGIAFVPNHCSPGNLIKNPRKVSGYDPLGHFQGSQNPSKAFMLQSTRTQNYNTGSGETKIMKINESRSPKMISTSSGSNVEIEMGRRQDVDAKCSQPVSGMQWSCCKIRFVSWDRNHTNEAISEEKSDLFQIQTAILQQIVVWWWTMMQVYCGIQTLVLHWELSRIRCSWSLIIQPVPPG